MVESAVFVAPCSVSCFAVFWANEKMPTKNSHHCCDRSFSDSDDGIQNSAGNLPVLRFKSSENSQNVAKKKKMQTKTGWYFSLTMIIWCRSGSSGHHVPACEKYSAMMFWNL
jgi:hypothetical protein